MAALDPLHGGLAHAVGARARHGGRSGEDQALGDLTARHHARGLQRLHAPAHEASAADGEELGEDEGHHVAVEALAVHRGDVADELDLDGGDRGEIDAGDGHRARHARVARRRLDDRLARGRLVAEVLGEEERLAGFGELFADPVHHLFEADGRRCQLGERVEGGEHRVLGRHVELREGGGDEALAVAQTDEVDLVETHEDWTPKLPDFIKIVAFVDRRAALAVQHVDEDD